MKIYHGTSKENADSILSEGFRRPEGVYKGICFVTDIELAKEYGDVVLECEIKEMERILFFEDEIIKKLKPKVAWSKQE